MSLFKKSLIGPCYVHGSCIVLHLFRHHANEYQAQVSDPHCRHDSLSWFGYHYSHQNHKFGRTNQGRYAPGGDLICNRLKAPRVYQHLNLAFWLFVDTSNSSLSINNSVTKCRHLSVRTFVHRSSGTPCHTSKGLSI